MRIGSLIWPRKNDHRDVHYEEATKQVKSELAQAVQTLDRRSHTVTRIAHDAIQSMHRGDGK